MAVIEDTIEVSVFLDAPVVPKAGFYPLYLVDEADGNSLGGDRFRIYQGGDTAADVTAGELSAAAAAAVNLGFSQGGTLARIIVARVDTAGGESYADALEILEALRVDFWAIAADTRAAVDQADIITWVNTENKGKRRKVFFGQTSDPAWKDGVHTPYDSTRTQMVWHDVDAQTIGLTWAAAVLNVDPDVRAVPFNVPLLGVEPYSTPLTATEETQLSDNNVNFFTPVGTYENRPSTADGSAKALSGRRAEVMYTADWFAIRATEAVSNFLAGELVGRRKVLVALKGSAQIEGVVLNVLINGVNAEHFLPNQIRTNFPLPSQADRDAAQISGEAYGMIAVGAGKIRLAAILTRTPVNEEEVA